MSFDVKVPASGESITSANVARWHKKNGDPVQKGDVLVTLETDKVSNELEAATDGILEILVGEGEEVTIGSLIARITSNGTAPTPASPPAPVQQSTPAPTLTPTPAPAQTTLSGSLIELKVPASGESITSANVTKWRKNTGEQVTQGEVLVTLETDKVSNELEAPASGRLKIIIPEGEEVAIGATIATIDTASPNKAQAPTPAVAPAAPAPSPTPTPAPTPAPTTASSAKPDFSAPTAPLERTTTETISDGRTSRKKMSMLRRKIATHLVNAQQTAAILTTFNEVDMTSVMDLRKQVQDEFMKKYGVKLGFMSFFIKAVTQALKDVPSINGRIDGTDIIENHFYDIGVAIGTEKGLVVPVLRDADKKSFAEIEQDILNYAKKAKDGKITIEDLSGGVFTISNGGTYGSLLSTPILNPPQSGILGMHTIQQRPVALNGQVVIRPMMYLALSYDHRLVDGKEAVTFLIRIKDCLESPTRLLLEM
jgi:2-oxoglutarate dehydrogenase E2 component (dihydrolipoamide succinyltransferase)